MMTLDEYAERILEPSIQRLEARTGKTRQQILAECEKQSAGARRFLQEIHDSIMSDQ